MRYMDKESFLLLLKLRPGLLLGREIIHNKNPHEILDISMSGDYLYLKGIAEYPEWVLASKLGEGIVIDELAFFTSGDKSGRFTVASLTEQIETLEKHVGQPSSDQSKPLFDIVAALNKELLELRLKFENMESKEIQHGQT